jgi:hypothetical protein
MSSLYRVPENFTWRIEAITPTAPGLRFRRWDGFRGDDPANASGWARRFRVSYEHLIEELGMTDGSIREAEHLFSLEVAYPLAAYRSHLARVQAMLRDADDLITCLRHDIRYVGYDDDNPSADIGLAGRWLDGQEIVVLSDDDDKAVHGLRQEWRVQVREPE